MASVITGLFYSSVSSVTEEGFQLGLLFRFACLALTATVSPVKPSTASPHRKRPPKDASVSAVFIPGQAPIDET